MTRIGIAVIVTAAVIGCGYDSTGYSSGGTTGNDSVTVVNNAFTPRTVNANDTGLVVWTWNSGGTTHNVTFEAAIAGSGDKSSGTFSHVFTAPGTYRYRCTIHSSAFGSGMSGQVVVADPGT